MDEKVGAHLILKAASRILEKGRQSGQTTTYRGLTVETDIDGYNVTLSGRDVRVTVMFHNQLDIYARNQPALDDFYDTIRRIAREGPENAQFPFGGARVNILGMNRRQMLSAVLAGEALIAIRSINSGADLIETSRQGLSVRLEALEARFDRMEHHQKNLVRVGALAFGVSTGIDMPAFL